VWIVEGGGKPDQFVSFSGGPLGVKEAIKIILKDNLVFGGKRVWEVKKNNKSWERKNKSRKRAFRVRGGYMRGVALVLVADRFGGY